ncbi:MAG: class SAM-dependent methyltransferase [Bacillales bacterium]|nr:class SAM-dependent methyltransferase [Bacillales bacterium]
MEDFDTLARGWDTENRLERAKAIANKIRSHISDNEKKTGMEYGCGTGLVGLHLTDCFSSLLFMDSSMGMIEQLKHKLSLINIENASTCCCDIMDSVPNQLEFDCIFSSLVLHHIKDIRMVLYRFHSLLNKGGRLFIIDLDEDDGSFHAKYPDFDGHNGFEQKALANVVEKAGFRKIKIDTFYYDSNIVNGEEKPYSLFILEAEK